jgi:SAM-dependent methyltransferase
MDDTFSSFLADVEQPFAGWDFSYLMETGRQVESPLPWGYASLILPYMWQASSMLDMGTGGGEFLSSLHPLPEETAATEGYSPNVPLARQRLEPLGVSVVAVGDDSSLPFPDGQFDLIINRHESYSASEVHRVLAPGGHFITQQVGGDNDNDLNRLLGAPEYDEFLHWTLQFATDEILGAGLNVVWSAETEMFTRFFDIGAVIYYLKAVPWQIADFSVDRYRLPLKKLHAHIQKHGHVDIPGQRFILIATRL